MNLTVQAGRGRSWETLDYSLIHTNGCADSSELTLKWKSSELCNTSVHSVVPGYLVILVASPGMHHDAETLSGELSA